MAHTTYVLGIPDYLFLQDEKGFANTPPITKAIRFLTLYLHVSTLNWILFRCSLQLNNCFFKE
jgi:hypothetical protein